MKKRNYKVWSEQEVAFVKARKIDRTLSGDEICDIVSITTPSLESITRDINKGKKPVNAEMLAMFLHFNNLKPNTLKDEKVISDGEKILAAEERKAEQEDQQEEETGCDPCPDVAEAKEVLKNDKIDTKVNQPEFVPLHPSDEDIGTIKDDPIHGMTDAPPDEDDYKGADDDSGTKQPDSEVDVRTTDKKEEESDAECCADADKEQEVVWTPRKIFGAVLIAIAIGLGAVSMYMLFFN